MTSEPEGENVVRVATRATAAPTCSRSLPSNFAARPGILGYAALLVSSAAAQESCSVLSETLRKIELMAYAQQSLPADGAHAASLAASRLEEGHDYGAVFTRRWVVELILDLVGYVPAADLAVQWAIEPACGSGAFLGPIVERLSRSCRQHGRRISEAADAIRACDLQPGHVAESRRVVEECLLADGWDRVDVRRLAERWVEHDDFLLGRHELGSADYVIGNPPYIRLEAVSETRSAAYRRTCVTMGGRADVYVGFFEVGLKTLRPGRALGFICADRYAQSVRPAAAPHGHGRFLRRHRDRDARRRRIRG